MKKLLFTCLLAGMYLNSGAQAVNALRLTGGFGSGEIALSIDGNRLHQLGKNDKFLLGYGVRFTHFGGGTVNYLTAPASLTTEGISDTLVLGSPRVYSLNAFVQLGYQFNAKWSATFDIDVVGASFGAERSGTFGSTEDPRFNGLQSGRPTTLNLLLVGDNDIGSLNSNFSLRYLVHEKWQVQAGYQFLFTEFTTKAVLANDNDRFRRKSGLLMLGVQYRL